MDKYAADMAVARGVRVSRHAAMAELLTFALNANEQLLALNKALRKRQKTKKEVVAALRPRERRARSW